MSKREKRFSKLLALEMWTKGTVRLGTNFGFPLASSLVVGATRKGLSIWAGDLLILIAFRLHNDREHRPSTSPKHKSCPAGQW